MKRKHALCSLHFFRSHFIRSAQHESFTKAKIQGENERSRVGFYTRDKVPQPENLQNPKPQNPNPQTPHGILALGFLISGLRNHSPRGRDVDEILDESNALLGRDAGHEPVVQDPSG